MPKELFNQGTVDEPSGSDRFALSVPGAVGGKNLLYSKLKEIMRRGTADIWSAGIIKTSPALFTVGNSFYILKDTVSIPFDSQTSPDLDTVNFEKIGRITDDELINIINGRVGDERIDASAIKNLNLEGGGGGGYAANIYFSALNSDIAGYKQSSGTADASETTLTPTVTSAEGNKLINQYIFNLPANTSIIQQGNWSFTFCAFVSTANGDTRVGFRPFRYTALGVKEFTFDAIVWSDEINQTVFEYKTASLIQGQKDILPTDRLGCDLYIKTTHNAAVTVNMIIGDGRAMYMNAPIALRHSGLRDLNQDPNYQHVTTAQISGWNGISADLFEQIVFPAAVTTGGLDFGAVGRQFNWRIPTGGVLNGADATIQTSAGAAYSLGTTVTGGNYLKIYKASAGMVSIKIERV